MSLSDVNVWNSEERKLFATIGRKPYCISGTKLLKNIKLVVLALVANAVALVVAQQNFGFDVITYLMVVATIGLVVLMFLAGEFGKRAQGAVDL